MIADPDYVSTLFLHLSLSLNQYLPGFVSECWIDPGLKIRLENDPIDLKQIPSTIEEFRSEIEKITDIFRKEYLQAQADALETVVKDLIGPKIIFRNYLKGIIGFDLN